MIVQVLKGMPRILTADWRAMPVTIPGKAIGSTTKNEMASRPKNLKRETASANNVPKNKAMAVAAIATTTDKTNESRKPWLPAVMPNQSVVKPGGGKVKVRSSVVKAYSKMIANGKYKNASATHVPNLIPNGDRGSRD